MSEQVGHGNTSETLSIPQPVNLSGAAVIAGASSTLGFYGATGAVRQAVTAVTAGGTTTAAKVTIARVYDALIALGLIE